MFFCYLYEKFFIMRKVINEDTIRKMVAKVLAESIGENLAAEYRTKGSLNKKTLEKQASQVDKTSGAASLDNDDYNPDWDDSVEDIMAKFSDDEEYDDSTAGGEYKIDFENPYFFTKDGNRVDADGIGNFHNDFAIVKKDGKVNYVDSDGVIISDDWFMACNDFENGFGMVSNGTKRNFVGSDGQLLLDVWVDRAGDFMGDEAPVIINGERHTVNRNGEIQ